jgi:hypothetical protein
MPVTVEQEQEAQARGRDLDILASAGDTYYGIEVQLGEVDASHSFRVFDYRARNRRRFPARPMSRCSPAVRAGPAAVLPPFAAGGG